MRKQLPDRRLILAVITVDDVAQALSIQRTTVRSMIKRGKLGLWESGLADAQAILEFIKAYKAYHELEP